MLCKSFLATALAVSTVLAGNSYMPPLPVEVRADLAKSDPSDYQTFQLRDDNIVMDRERHFESLTKRRVPNNLKGLQYKCNTKNCMSITFDDGVYKNMKYHRHRFGCRNQGDILNLYNYACSYDEEYSSQVKYAYEKGMEICNHSATHPHFSNLTYAQIDTEIELVETFLHKVIGVVPAAIRLPYGDGNATIAKYLNDKHSLAVVNWNEYSGDADGESVAFSENVYDHIHTPEQAIVLNHEPYNTTAHIVFPYAIKKLMQNGYKKHNFQTVSESMGFNPYKSVTKPGKRDASWNCKAGIAARCATNPNPDICGPGGPKTT